MSLVFATVKFRRSFHGTAKVRILGPTVRCLEIPEAKTREKGILVYARNLLSGRSFYSRYKRRTVPKTSVETFLSPILIPSLLLLRAPSGFNEL